MRAALGVCAALAFLLAPLTPARAQPGGRRAPDPRLAPDLRRAHEDCARSLVRIERSDGQTGSGWIADLGPHRYIITNAHVVEGEHYLWVEFADGLAAVGEVGYVSSHIDLAILSVTGGIAAPALSFVAGTVVRGERVVIGGNPGGLSFITSEGVVAGTVSGTPLSAEACGAGAECIVLDAEAEPGSSGGPVVDGRGRVIGMIWGVYLGSSFSIAIPASALGAELMIGERAVMARELSAALAPRAVDPDPD